MSDNSDSTGCGCVPIILSVLFIWALLFGVTISGQHYGLSGCTFKEGVKIDR